MNNFLNCFVLSVIQQSTAMVMDCNTVEMETAPNRFTYLRYCMQLCFVSSTTTFSIRFFCFIRPSLQDLYNDIDSHLEEVEFAQVGSKSAAGHFSH
jgi:predicted choloylglycine hydrolase